MPNVHFKSAIFGRERIAGLVSIPMISQDDAAFPFPPVEWTCGSDNPLSAWAGQYIHRINKLRDSHYEAQMDDDRFGLGSSGASSLDDLIADRIPHQFAYRVYLQFPHDIGPVRFSGFDTDTE